MDAAGSPSSTRESLARGIRGDAEHVGGVGEAELLHEYERDDLGVSRGKSIQDRGKVLGTIVMLAALLRDRLGRGLGARRWETLEKGAVSPLVSREVAHDVVGRGQQPGEHRAVDQSHGAPLAPQLEKGGGDGILGVRR